MVAELNNVKAKVAELKTSTDTSATHVRCLGWEHVRLKAAQAEKVQNVARRVVADQSVRLDAFQREVTVLRQVNKDSEAQVRRLTENQSRYLEKSFGHHELLFGWQSLRT